MTGRPADGRRALGAAGERLTARYLEARGYRILARNVRLSRGEIDLVAEQGGCLVLIEVRLRRGTGTAVALESISAAKRRRLRMLAAEYCARLDPVPDAVRIDVVAVSIGWNGRLEEVLLVENAVEADERG